MSGPIEQPLRTPKNPLCVAVCIPSGDSWAPEFGMSLANLAMFMNVERVPGFDGQKVDIYLKKSSLVMANREQLVQAALKNPMTTHILFVDTDQEFPPYTIHQLVQHRLPLVAANISTRALPAGTNSRYSGTVDDVVTSLGVSGLEEVWSVGTGLMLLERKVFEAIPQPWFMPGWVPEANDYVGEDVMFVQKVRKAGIKLMVDHDLSVQIGHWGNYRYTHYDVDVAAWAKNCVHEKQRVTMGSGVDV